MNIIVLHDFLVAKGGAENLILTLVTELGNKGHEVELVVAYVDEQLFQHFSKKIKVTALGRQARGLGWESIKTLWLFWSRFEERKDVDVCYFSGIYSPVAVFHKMDGVKVHYCHTPPRFVYDLKDYYIQRAHWWQRPPLALLRLVVKQCYVRSLKHMDKIYVNSINVQTRLQTYLGLSSEVVYPPVNTEAFYFKVSSGYYLSTARLEPYKRVDLIIRAFGNMPDKKLIVASSGSDEQKLKQLAKNNQNIQFTGWLDSKKLEELIEHSIATIYLPIAEDFGISPVESMAAGKPVIGVAEGGLNETIINQKTGILLRSPVRVEDIQMAVINMDENTAENMSDACQRCAKRFSIKNFIDNVM